MNRFDNYENDFLSTIKDPTTTHLLNIYDTIYRATYEFFFKNNILISSPPITTSSVTSPMGLGSDSLPYKVKSLDENGKQFYLADSMQFHLELLLRGAENKGVGYLMSTFRGEKIDERHLHEFNHSEVEIKGDLQEVKNFIERYIKFLIKKNIDHNEKDLNFFGKDRLSILKNDLSKEFKNITFNQALEILNDEYKEGISQIDGCDNINSNGEKHLIKKYDSNFLWLNDFPEILVPFYQESENGLAKNADLLMGIGEIIGCGERWRTGDEVLKSIKKHKNNPDQYKWYIEMKKRTPIKTSGFGLGIERFILYILGIHDIREVQIIPRLVERNITP